jgi:hypothetical protein
VTFVRTDILEDGIASSIRMKRISELGTTLAVIVILLKYSDGFGWTVKKYEIFLVKLLETRHLEVRKGSRKTVSNCFLRRWIMENGIFWDVTPCGSCKTEVSEELNASVIRVTRIGELGTTLAVTSN